MRLTSLDVFRGIAIASMILANNPGSWDYVYPWLLHAEWHGFTAVDLVFPAFIFIAGVAMAFSLAKYAITASLTNNKYELPIKKLYPKLIKRCLVLFGLGLGLNLLTLIFRTFPNIDLQQLRIMGVLQRIALAYLLGSIAIFHLSWKKLATLSIVLLLGYWGAMTLIPVPEFGAGNLSPEGNLGAYFDRLILTTSHLLKQGKFDPEGLFSTIPSVVTFITGYFTGEWLRRQTITSKTSINLVIFGLSCLVIGYLWGFVFPINKQLWTSSYVIYSTGWCLLLLGGLYEAIEVRNWRRWFFPLEVLGVNAILLFVASGIFARILLFTHIGKGEKPLNTYTWIYQNFFQSWAGNFNGSLAFAIVTLLFWWVILYLLYRRQWIFKV